MSAPKKRFKTYTVPRAKARFDELLADVAAGCVVEITRRGVGVASVLQSETLETLEIMANPDAMRILRAAKEGKLRYRPLPADLDTEPSPAPKPAKRKAGK